jgi:mannose-6-phosphate isomerase
MTADDRAPSSLVLAPYERPKLIWGTERWLLSDRPGQASIVQGGPFSGAPLTALVDRFGERLVGVRGRRADGRFALLVKLLATHDRLSVQVHPGHEHLAHLPPGAESKEEAWLVLRADPGARIHLGTRPGHTPLELQHALRRGTVERELGWFEARVGDVVHVRPGTLHAIGAGLTLAEVQESSDTTYRVWDWGRLEDGRPRPLHVAEARAVTRFDRAALSDRRAGAGSLPTADTELLAVAPFRMAWRVLTQRQQVAARADSFLALTLLAGRAAVVDAPGELPVGGTLFLPPGTASGVIPVTAASFLEVSLP